MSTHRITESDVEDAALAWLTDAGYTYIHGPDIARGQPAAERVSYRDVILRGRLRDALVRLNPTLPSSAIEDEIRARRRTNLVQSGSFAKKLSAAVDRYNQQAVSAMRVITALIELAREMQAASQRGDDLGLSTDELAFYDALAANQSAVEVMGDEQLAYLARELLQTVRRNATIDWSVQESARAKMRVEVKRLLRKSGYPPDLLAAATKQSCSRPNCWRWTGFDRRVLWVLLAARWLSMSDRGYMNPTVVNMSQFFG